MSYWLSGNVDYPLLRVFIQDLGLISWESLWKLICLLSDMVSSIFRDCQEYETNISILLKIEYPQEGDHITS